MKHHGQVLQKVGRLRERCSRVNGQYDISVTPAAGSVGELAGECQARSARWVGRCLCASHFAERLGRCAHRASVLDDERGRDDVPESEVGLRTVCHQKKSRVAAHLFISVLADHAVHFLCMRIRVGGENRVRQNIEPNDSQRRLLTAMGLEYFRRKTAKNGIDGLRSIFSIPATLESPEYCQNLPLTSGRYFRFLSFYP